ncbi:MAG TPA: hypothetical protein VM076_22635 [Gemmatimonadaceae bacterium]|nr:hypothetical protein [Gemmatimonadaceae bacterium]
MTDSTSPSEHEQGEPEDRAVKAAAPVGGAAAGAIAGAAAGLATMAFGPFGAMVGAIVGALGGTAAGSAAAGAAGTEPLYTEDDDAQYRALWEGTPHGSADRGFDSARVAYQFGHIAAHRPEFNGARFADAEPKLRQRWNDDLRSKAGEWDAVRSSVQDAYGHAQSGGAGQRRDTSVIGSAGSAVDPVELERARAGLPSVPEPEQRA